MPAVHGTGAGIIHHIGILGASAHGTTEAGTEAAGTTPAGMTLGIITLGTAVHGTMEQVTTADGTDGIAAGTAHGITIITTIIMAGTAHTITIHHMVQDI